LASSSTVVINIHANSHVTPTMVVLIHQLEQVDRQADRTNRTLAKVRASMVSAAKAIARVTATVAAAASAVGPLTTGLLAAGKAMATFGKAAARLTPLAALLPSLAGALGLIVGTLKVAGPGLAKVLEPVTKFFRTADGEAGAFAKRLQSIIGIGVKPLATAFAVLNLPHIATAMERITYSVNNVITSFGGWLNSVEGVNMIRSITEGTADAFRSLEPKIINAAVALGRLAGRAGNKAITGLGDLIGRILDKFTAWANSTSMEDINRALKDLAGYGDRLKATWVVIRDIGQWLSSHQDQIRSFSDAMAGGAIALGVATGNLPAIIGGAVTLIINHWSQLKGVFAGAGGWIGEMADRWTHDWGRQQVAKGVQDTLIALRDGFRSATEDIGPKWTAFINSVKGAWQEWAPIIGAWWSNIGAPIFRLIGEALGTWLSSTLDVLTRAATGLAALGQAFRALIPPFLNMVSTIITGAAKAFGWMPEIGPKLRTAAAEFEAFKNRVNADLAGIQTMKTITIRTVYITEGRRPSQSDQRTGDSRQSGFSGASSWRPAMVAAAFMASGLSMAGANPGGVSRTAAPTQVAADVNVNVSLDGTPVVARINSMIMANNRRQAWRDKGRR
jgi:hypothetical protein